MQGTGGKGKSTFKDPEVEACVGCSRNSKEARDTRRKRLVDHMKVDQVG